MSLFLTIQSSIKNILAIPSLAIDNSIFKKKLNECKEVFRFEKKKIESHSVYGGYGI